MMHLQVPAGNQQTRYDWCTLQITCNQRTATRLSVTVFSYAAAWVLHSLALV